jgi:outer membrane autotransporter protein
MNFVGKKLALSVMVALAVLSRASIGLAADLVYNTSTTITSPVVVSSPDKVVIYRGASVDLNADMNITGTPASHQSLYILEGATLNVGAGQTVAAWGELQLEGGPNGTNTSIFLNSGSRVIIDGTGTTEEGYFGLGNYYRNSQSGNGGFYLTDGYDNRGVVRAVVNGNGVYIDANQCFEITKDSNLIISPNSDLTIDADNLWGDLSNLEGLFIAGKLENFGSWDNVGTDEPWREKNGLYFVNSMGEEPMEGGRVTIRANSRLTINSPIVLFGETSILEMAPASSLKVNGTLYLNRNESRDSGTPFVLTDFETDNLFVNSGVYSFNGTAKTNGVVNIYDSRIIVEDSFSNIANDEGIEVMSSEIVMTTGSHIDLLGELWVAADHAPYHPDSIGPPSIVYMSAGSTINSPVYSNMENGLNLGSDDGPTSKGYLIVDTAGGSPAILNTSFTNHVQNGAIEIMDNSTLNINFDVTGPVNSHGVLLLGGGDASASSGIAETQSVLDDLNFVDKNNNLITVSQIHPSASSGPVNWAGYDGQIIMHPGSSLNVAGRVYFGNKSAVNVGLNTLSISGDTWFKNGSIYYLTRSDTASGSISIGGLTTVEDEVKLYVYGPLAVNSSNNVILSSAGGFASSNVFVNDLFQLEISGNDIIISGYSGSGPIINQVGGGGASPNNGSFAGFVDRILSEAGSSPQAQALAAKVGDVLQTIDALYNAGHAGEASMALRQFIGEEALTSISAAVETIHQAGAALGKRFGTLLGSPSAPSAGYGSAQERLWAAGFGSWARQKDASGLLGYKYSTGGVILGFDHEVAALPGLTLGINGAFSKGKLKSNDHLTETDVDTYGFGLYGLYQAQNGFFVEANIGLGKTDNDLESTRVLSGTKSRGDFDSANFQAGFNLGYKFKLADNVSLIPSVGLQYIRIKQDSWQEKMAANVPEVAHWYGDSKQDFVEIPVSLKLESNHQVGGVVLTPEIHAGAIFTANDPESRMRMGFVGSNSSVFLTGIDSGKNRFQGGTSLKVQVNGTIDFFAAYDVEARSKYTSHYAQLGLGFSF